MRKVLFLSLVTIVMCLLLAEFLVRLIGYPIYKPVPIVWAPKPKNFFIYDSLLGYKIDSGTYFYTYQGRSTLYKSTHNSIGQRITSLNDTVYEKHNKHTIGFLGGTNVYGMEMQDEETLPFIFQNIFPSVKVRNMGVPEYGMAANYVLLTRYTKIKTGDVFVCMYFSAHDHRPPRKILKATYASIKAGTLEGFPTLSIDDNLKTRLVEYNYKLWPLNNYSALVNFSEDQYNKFADEHSKAHETAKKVIKAISDTCKAHGATFVLIGRRNDKQTLKMIDYCSRNEVHATYLPMAGKSLLKSSEDKIRDKERFSKSLMRYLLQEKIVDSTYLSQTLH